MLFVHVGKTQLHQVLLGSVVTNHFPVGHIKNLHALGSGIIQKLFGTRHGPGFSGLHPGRPGLGRIAEVLTNEPSLVGRIVNNRLIGVDYHRNRFAAGVAIQKTVQIHGGNIEGLIAQRFELGRRLHPQSCHDQLFIEILGRVHPGGLFCGILFHGGTTAEQKNKQQNRNHDFPTISTLIFHTNLLVRNLLNGLERSKTAGEGLTVTCSRNELKPNHFPLIHQALLSIKNCCR